MQSAGDHATIDNFFLRSKQMSLTATFLMKLNIVNTKDLDLNDVLDVLTNTLGPSFTDGTGANQAQILFHDTTALADAANHEIDILDGSLTDAFGDAVTITKLKVLYIKNLSTTANLIIGGAAATQLGLFGDGASDKLHIPPLGEFFYSAPDATGLDTSVNAHLKFEHDGTGASAPGYNIIMIGVD